MKNPWIPHTNLPTGGSLPARSADHVVIYCQYCEARVVDKIWYEVLENYDFSALHREQKRVKILCRKCYRERLENGSEPQVTVISKGRGQSSSSYYRGICSSTRRKTPSEFPVFSRTTEEVS
jgi:hypothetical protein